MEEKQLSPNTRYKKTTLNSKPINVHKKVILLALNLQVIPKNFCIHHIDGNKRNNDINNLALLTFSAHNLIHSHTPWNKGITIKTSEKWKNTVKKIHITRNNHYLPLFKEAYDLYKQGLSVIQIGKKINKDRNTVYNRIKKYEQFIIRRKD